MKRSKLFKEVYKKKAGSILRLIFALSKLPYFHRVYLLTICKRGAMTVGRLKNIHSGLSLILVYEYLFFTINFNLAIQHTVPKRAYNFKCTGQSFVFVKFTQNCTFTLFPYYYHHIQEKLQECFLKKFWNNFFESQFL